MRLADGRTCVPVQGNNAYIFPGVGLGVSACGATRVTDEMFYIAAKTLAIQVSEQTLATGSLYPPLREIRKVSLEIAKKICELAYASNLATVPRPANLEVFLKSQMYEPAYEVSSKL